MSRLIDYIWGNNSVNCSFLSNITILNNLYILQSFIHTIGQLFLDDGDCTHHTDAQMPRLRFVMFLKTLLNNICRLLGFITRLKEATAMKECTWPATMFRWVSAK